MDEFTDELTALQAMAGEAREGDVIGVTALGMRSEMFAWLEAQGATWMTPDRRPPGGQACATFGARRASLMHVDGCGDR